MTKNPCDSARTGWWVRVRRRQQVERDLEKSGKWLLFINCAWVGRVWSRVVADVRAGLLGPAAKVSTHKPSPLRRTVGQHVICVYTESFEDRDDLLRVAKRLVTTAELKKMPISYKSDAQTLAGKYSWNAADGVALYRFVPPYEELGTPTSPSMRDGASVDEGSDGFCGGCGRPVRATRRNCPSCGWVFNSDVLACLAREDLPPRQRRAIELELQAVAETGPRAATESAESYGRRVRATLALLAAATHG